MNREPSIHITESNLIKVLDEVMDHMQDEPEWWNETSIIAKLILERAKKYQLSNRKLLAKTNTELKKANTIAKSPLEDAMLMAKIIYQSRKNLKHRGIEIAKPNSRDFTLIKTITSHAIEYHETLDEEIPRVAAFTRYINAYLELMQGKFNLITLQNKAPQIIEYAEAVQQIGKDKLGSLTTRAYNRYNELVVKQIGELYTEYRKQPAMYKYFMQVSQAAREKDIEPEIWIDAQFEGLAWTKGIPEPPQLVGPKALERLQKYIFAHADKINKPKQEKEHKKKVNSLLALKKIK